MSTIGTCTVALVAAFVFLAGIAFFIYNILQEFFQQDVYATTVWFMAYTVYGLIVVLIGKLANSLDD